MEKYFLKEIMTKKYMSHGPEEELENKMKEDVINVRRLDIG